MNEQVLGYVGAAIACLCFGSNYIVTKKFPTGDGLIFSWGLSYVQKLKILQLRCGILIVGICTIPFGMTSAYGTIFVPLGLLSGFLWSMGNLCVPVIIKMLGLGVGQMLWSGGCLIGGYLVGKIGLFVPAEVITDTGKQIMNISGIVFGVLALLCTVFVRPTTAQAASKPNEDTQAASESGALTSRDHDNDHLLHPTITFSAEKPRSVEVPRLKLQSITVTGNDSDHDTDRSHQELNDTHDRDHPVDDNHKEPPKRSTLFASSFLDTQFIPSLTASPWIQEPLSRFKAFTAKCIAFLSKPWIVKSLGSILAVGTGIIYGVNLIPFKMWFFSQTNVSPASFCISYAIGIYLTHTAVLIMYALFKRNHPQVFAQSLLPSMISGALWCVASVGLMYSIAYLGFAIGFSMTSIGPMIVSAFWNVVVFREISGWKNLIFMAISLLFASAGVVLLALSK